MAHRLPVLMRLLAAFLVGAALVALFARLPTDPSDPAGTAVAVGTAHLTQAAPTIDELVDRFMTALEHRDSDALHTTRVDEAEYRQIIIPGTVEPGRPPRQVSRKPQEFFWQLLDTKSRYFAEELMNTFGGRKYVDRRIAFTQASRPYAGYRAHGELRLTLRDESGNRYFLRSGWIAEVGGGYKFIGFEWDD